MTVGGPVLAFDFASSRASIALASHGEVLASGEGERGESEPQLLARIDAVCADAGLAPRGLAAVVALAGPGSFTGLRIACATALGLGRALDVPAGGLSTLEAQALAVDEVGDLLSVVDALRGEWFVQRFSRDRSGAVAAAEARLWRPGDPLPPAHFVVGLDAARFTALSSAPPATAASRNLAVAAALAANRPEWRWRPELLARPLYLRSPATTRPRR